MATFAAHDTDHLTIHYEDGEDGWVTATIEEEPAAISQGRTREEAYANVLEALHDLTHEPTPGERMGRLLEERVTAFFAWARAYVHRRTAA
jgi:hypothetical protein